MWHTAWKASESNIIVFRRGFRISSGRGLQKAEYSGGFGVPNYIIQAVEHYTVHNTSRGHLHATRTQMKRTTGYVVC